MCGRQTDAANDRVFYLLVAEDVDKHSTCQTAEQGETGPVG